MNNTLLIISEFEPVHLWLEKILQEKISKDIAEVLFCIDGAYRKSSDETPFTTHEREEMIRIMMKKFDVKYNFLHLRDEDTDEWRKASIDTILKPYAWATVLSENDITNNIVNELWHNWKNIRSRRYIPGVLRNQIASWHVDALQAKIQKEILDYIESINWYERSREMKIHLFHWPSITVDIIARNEKWEIAIIDRGWEPHWKALPGWFIEYWDSGETTSAKECGEETNMKGNFASTDHQTVIKKKISELISENNIQYWYEQQPFYVMTDTQRDKRWHLITLWYMIDVTNPDEIDALDDADDVQFMDPYVALHHPQVLPDHKVLIAAYIAQL